MATSQWYPGLGWTVRNGMSHLLVGFVAVRTTDGYSCSLLSVGLIPPRGGVVYINNYSLAVVHLFKGPEDIHLEKEEGRKKKRNYGASAPDSVRPSPGTKNVTYLRRDGTHFLTSPCDRRSGGEVVSGGPPRFPVWASGQGERVQRQPESTMDDGEEEVNQRKER